MLRIDLKPAGIEAKMEGVDGVEHVDFHSLRHSLVHMLSTSGVSLRQSMRIARHTDPKLTAARYGPENLKELASAMINARIDRRGWNSS